MIIFHLILYIVIIMYIVGVFLYYGFIRNGIAPPCPLPFIVKLIPLFLADERDAVQKKTFTKWVNSHLARVSCRISDLYNDLRDGYMLTRLLEVLSGELLVREHTQAHNDKS